MATKSVQIALCSDTHYWPGCAQPFGQEGEQLQPWSEDIQAALLADLSKAKPDFLLHLGDFTCGGGTFQMPESTFFHVFRKTNAEYRALPVEYFALPGNHDCPPGTGDYAVGEEILGLERRQGRTIDLPAARLVMVNALGHSPEQIAAALPGDPIYGWVADEELARVDEALATAGERPVLLFIHQLLMPWSGPAAWVDYYAVKNAASVLEIMARHGNVRAVFQGHAHMFDVQQVPVGDQAPFFIIVPALILYPLAWLSLQLSSDSMELRLHRLPLPELAERSRRAGSGQDWRAGRPEWQQIQIPLL
jgi:Icc protein